ncbi:hypothetical protein NP493_2065g00005 [Ridgeia piscesae]|uniref:Uncharacterized protein n=1 Tax=Ridgeia piscesae TaxID=27915 RepID=A0AAD9N5Z7_RIDPI|nr:hypothetical protein NP493_2065g00002 [Ridgeia piscesae]KAK2155559.1 hypothetical protein NP493_2065g00005 [Ridgeia piscesae]
MLSYSDSGKHIVKGRMGAQKGFLIGMFQRAETLPGRIIIPTSVVDADNSHRVNSVLTNASCSKMEIPKRQNIATMMNVTFFVVQRMEIIENETAVPSSVSMVD